MLSVMVRSLAATILLILFSAPQPTAVEEFARLNQQAHAAKQANDNTGYLQAALKMQDLLNNAPDAVFAVARAYAAAGDTKNALASLHQYADLGQANASLLQNKDETFAALRDLPEYKTILDRLKANQSPISKAQTALSLTDPNILPEDIDFDPTSKSFLITSVLEKKIIRVTLDGATTDFAQSPDHWPMMALKVDAPHNRLWATEVALNGFTTAPKSDWGRSALLSFNLHTGALTGRTEGPPNTALGDMVLTPHGDPILSDGDNGGIYRLIDSQLKQINARDFISPQTPAILPDGQHLFLPDYVRGIGLLSLKSNQVIWLNRQAENQHASNGHAVDSHAINGHAINGIDGLYLYRDSIILTQNGTSPERIVRMRLNPSQTEIVSEEIIEQATTTLGDPTHGVIVGNVFYYIANSGWNNLDEHGNPIPGSKPTPAQIMRHQLN